MHLTPSPPNVMMSLHDDLHGGLLRGDVLHGVLGDKRALLDADPLDACAIPGQGMHTLDSYALQPFQPDASQSAACLSRDVSC